VVETLFSTALCGVLFAIVGGQPLVVVGVTGPIVIFTRTIYSIAKDLDLDFLQFYSWIGVCTPLLRVMQELSHTCTSTSWRHGTHRHLGNADALGARLGQHVQAPEAGHVALL
jgi:hypothetical protein